MKYSAQLEREAEHNRAEVEETLDEIRSRLRPGQLVDQLVDYARDGAGAEFYGNLKRQIAENPLPVTVIGAGLAWLALSSNSSHPRRARSSAMDYGATRERAYGTVQGAERRAKAIGAGLSDSLESTTDAAAGMARTASAAAQRGTARLRETVTSTGAAVSERVSSAYAGATDAASRTGHKISERMSSAGHSLAEGSRNFADFCREQPLVLAGIGVALGAALGAMLPSTETENRLMGDAADDAKERVQGIVGEQVDKAQAIASESADRLAESAREGMDRALDAADAGKSESSDGGGMRSASSASNPDVEWTTRDGSGRAADSGFPTGERPSNG